MKKNDPAAEWKRSVYGIITQKRPDLRGKFSKLHIWDALVYLREKHNLTAKEAADRFFNALAKYNL